MCQKYEKLFFKNAVKHFVHNNDNLHCFSNRKCHRSFWLRNAWLLSKTFQMNLERYRTSSNQGKNMWDLFEPVFDSYIFILGRKQLKNDCNILHISQAKRIGCIFNLESLMEFSVCKLRAYDHKWFKKYTNSTVKHYMEAHIFKSCIIQFLPCTVIL